MENEKMNPILSLLVSNAPSLVDAASKLYDRFISQADDPAPAITHNSETDILNVRAEIEKIESLTAAQSEIVKEIAEQQRLVADALAKSAAKANIAIVLASIAVLFSFISLFR